MAFSYYAIELNTQLIFKEIIDFDSKYEALVWYKVNLEHIPKSNFRINKDNFELFIHRIEGDILHLLVNRFCYLNVNKECIFVKKNINPNNNDTWYYLC